MIFLAKLMFIPWLFQIVAGCCAIFRRRAGKQQLITSYIVILLPLIGVTLATGGMFLFYLIGFLFSDQDKAAIALIFILPTIVAAFILPFIKIKY